MLKLLKRIFRSKNRQRNLIIDLVPKQEASQTNGLLQASLTKVEETQSVKTNIECPSCSVKYIIEPNALGDNGRTVKCSKCETVWFEKANSSLDNIHPQESVCA